MTQPSTAPFCAFSLFRALRSLLPTTVRAPSRSDFCAQPAEAIESMRSRRGGVGDADQGALCGDDLLKDAPVGEGQVVAIFHCIFFADECGESDRHSGCVGARLRAKGSGRIGAAKLPGEPLATALAFQFLPSATSRRTSASPAVAGGRMRNSSVLPWPLAVLASRRPADTAPRRVRRRWLRPARAFPPRY